MILAGGRVNDGMGKYVAERAVKMLIYAGKQVQGATIAVLGITFKENVPDLRNTKVVDIIEELVDYGVRVLVNDPLADAEEAKRYYGVDLKDMTQIKAVDGVVIAVAHREYLELGFSEIAALCGGSAPLILDVKGVFGHRQAEQKGVIYWRL